jgi:hypothetical protein
MPDFVNLHKGKWTISCRGPATRTTASTFLVVTDKACNGFKSSSLAAAEHVVRRARHFLAGSTEDVQLGDLAGQAVWDRHAVRSVSVARAIQLRLPEDWVRGRQFTAPDATRIGTALSGRVSKVRTGG